MRVFAYALCLAILAREASLWVQRSASAMPSRKKLPDMSSPLEPSCARPVVRSAFL